MLVVSDTSPLNYLILVDAVNALPALYGKVIVPTGVAAELIAAGAPQKTREWIKHAPAWLEMRPAPSVPRYADLDEGESQAIALAKAMKADLLLVDERRATEIARNVEKLETTGTLGVLLDAALAKLIDLKSCLIKLEQTNFHAPAALLRQVAAEYERRK